MLKYYTPEGGLVLDREMTWVPRLHAFSEARRAFEADVDDGTLANAAAMIFPAERDMHEDVVRPKALAAFRWSPDDDEAAARQNALDAIVLVAVERFDVD